MFKNAKKGLLGKPFTSLLGSRKDKDKERASFKNKDNSSPNSPVDISGTIATDSVTTTPSLSSVVEVPIHKESNVNNQYPNRNEPNLRTLVHNSEQSALKSLPMVILNEDNIYNVEGFAQLDDQNIRFYDNNQLHYDKIEDYEIIETNREYNYYIKHFYDREHFNFVGKIFDSKTKTLDDFVLSFKLDSSLRYLYILRTKYGNKFEELDDTELSILDVMEKLSTQEVKEIMPVIHPLASEKIVRYDKKLIKQTFTFGIIYQKYGQVTEKEIFSNHIHSVEFEEFLQFIGVRVKLKNFKGFRGGLDINSNTDYESVYEQYENSEIMFHVSTLLPHSNTDEQQLEKKRHIGNDKVAIIFQDNDTPFSPSLVKSKLLHVFLLIQPVKVNGVTKRYKLSIVSRKDVPYFGPFIRRPFVYKKNRNLKNFLLAKLINAEYSSLMAPGFSQYSVVALTQSLAALTNDLKKVTTKFNDCFKVAPDANLSSVLKRSSVYKVITNKTNLDAIKDPLNRALSKSGLIENKSDNASFEEVDNEKKSPDTLIKDIKKRREKNNSESNFSNEIRDDSSLDNKKQSIVHAPLAARSTFTYGDSREAVESKQEKWSPDIQGILKNTILENKVFTELDIPLKQPEKTNVTDSLPIGSSNFSSFGIKSHDSISFNSESPNSLRERRLKNPKYNTMSVVDEDQSAQPLSYHKLVPDLENRLSQDSLNPKETGEKVIKPSVDEDEKFDNSFIEYLSKNKASLKRHQKRFLIRKLKS